MKPPLRSLPGLTALLCLPAVALAAPPAQAASLQLDSGSLGLLGAGLVALAISLRLRRRS